MRILLLSATVVVLALPGCVMQSTFDQKVAELGQVESARAAVEMKQRETEKKLQDETAKREALDRQVAELEKERAALRQENANIKGTLETSRSQLTKDVVELKNRLSVNEERIKTLDAELAAKNAQIAQLSQEKEAVLQEKERALAEMKSTHDTLLSELKQEIKEGEIQITQLKDKLTVNMVDKILFDSGSAVIKKNGKKVLDRVAVILKDVKNRQIRVEGHTDNVPIGPGLADRFPSNWELSTARATTVVRYLQEQGVSPGLLGAEGYGEHRPVAPNDTDGNKAKNRRIEIVLVPMDR